MTAESFQQSPHAPVMLEEAVELLDVRPGLTYVDATAGGGGHLCRILDKVAGPGGRVIGIDRDEVSLNALRQRLGDRATLIHSNFADLKESLDAIGISTVSGGILADLGVSSMQLDDPERGFSFLKEGPLDMRMDRNQKTTAEHLVNTLDESELADILYQYGEERESRAIARAIASRRPVTTTTQLADIVAGALTKARYRKQGGHRKRGPVDSSHPATRTFQAIRIAVNNELQSVEKFLEEAMSILAPGARLAVITFHSLEDRLVKQFLRLKAATCVCPPRMPVCNCGKKQELLIITRKPVCASDQEVLANIRSRSAKLRAGIKVG